MSLVVGTNTSAQFAQDALRANQNKIATAMQRLSTGLRINSARDDAAGLAISQSMTSQIRGLNQAVRNINDGVNLLQTAEGGLGSITDMLQRMRELAVQSANGTNSDAQRAYLQKEAAALQEQISKVVDTTTWNDKKLLDGSFTGQKIQVGADSGATMELNVASPIDSLKGWTKVMVGNTNTTTDPLAITVSNDGAVYGNAITTGLDGSVYVGSSTDGGALEAVVTKLNSDGSLAWTTTLPGSQFAGDGVLAITTGQDGSIYVSGYAQDNGTQWAYLSKITSDGITEWNREVDLGHHAIQGMSLTTSADGSIHLTGLSGGSFDGQTAIGKVDGFLMKFSADGSKLWTRIFGSSDHDLTYSVATGKDGGIYVGGETFGSINGQTFLGGDQDAFIKKYNADGTEAWTRQFGSSGIDTVAALATGSDGSVYMSGYIESSTNSQPQSGNFLAKYDSQGAALWIHFTTEWYSALSQSDDGGFYAASAGNLSKFSPDGEKDWTKQGTNFASVYPTGISKLTNGSIFVTGRTDGVSGLNPSYVDAAFATKYIISLNFDISTQDGASSTIGAIDITLDSVNSTRSTIGSYINRLNYAADNATNISTNLSASRSTIQDTDYAYESANLAKSQITQQAATAMLVQANQQPQSVLALLKNL